MGLYFSSRITCLDCGNFNSFDSGFDCADETLMYISRVRPKITCGRCGSTRIQASDHYFCSVDMSGSNSEGAYVPENVDETWSLPDCQLRLPDMIYLDVKHIFQHNKVCNLCVHFSDFKNYIERQLNCPDRPIVAFRRVKGLSDVQDLYVSVDDSYSSLRFCPVYLDRIPEGRTFEEYETDEIRELNRGNP